MEYKDLHNAQVGDVLMLGAGNWHPRRYERVTVARATKHHLQLFDGGIKYRRHNGLAVGSDHYSSTRLEKFDEAVYEEAERQERLARARRVLREYRWDRADAELVAEVLDIVRAHHAVSKTNEASA